MNVPDPYTLICSTRSQDWGFSAETKWIDRWLMSSHRLDQSWRSNIPKLNRLIFSCIPHPQYQQKNPGQKPVFVLRVEVTIPDHRLIYWDGGEGYWPADAKSLPSGLIAKQLTAPSCPWKIRTQFPRWTSHNRHVRSLDPVAIYKEFGWKVTHYRVPKTISYRLFSSRPSKKAHRKEAKEEVLLKPRVVPRLKDLHPRHSRDPQTSAPRLHVHNTRDVRSGPDWRWQSRCPLVPIQRPIPVHDAHDRPRGSWRDPKTITLPSRLEMRREGVEVVRTGLGSDQKRSNIPVLNDQPAWSNSSSFFFAFVWLIQLIERRDTKDLVSQSGFHQVIKTCWPSFPPSVVVESDVPSSRIGSKGSPLRFQSLMKLSENPAPRIVTSSENRAAVKLWIEYQVWTSFNIRSVVDQGNQGLTFGLRHEW